MSHINCYFEKWLDKSLFEEIQEMEKHTHENEFGTMLEYDLDIINVEDIPELNQNDLEELSNSNVLAVRYYLDY